MATTSAGSGRPRLVKASTDPVVVGLGRLLMGLGALALVGILTLLAMFLLWVVLLVCGALIPIVVGFHVATTTNSSPVETA